MDSKLPDQYSDEEWEGLSIPEKQASWRRLLRALADARGRLDLSDPWVREKFASATTSMKAAVERILELGGAQDSAFDRSALVLIRELVLRAEEALGSKNGKEAIEALEAAKEDLDAVIERLKSGQR